MSFLLMMGYCSVVDFTFGPAFFVSLVFSLFGMAYFSYGKKQGNTMALVSGIGLMFYPYLVSDVTMMVAVGIGLLVFPFVVSRFL